MRLEDLIAGKNDKDVTHVAGFEIPVSALKKLLDEGYENLQPYEENKTFSVWGKNCTACFTEDQFRPVG
jgi:hypothetical protein